MKRRTTQGGLTTSLTSLLTELALSRRISWTDAATVLDAQDAAERAQEPLDALLTAAGAGPTLAAPATRSLSPAPTVSPWSNPFGHQPRDLAVFISMAEAISGYPTEMRPHFWVGATAMEAYAFDLHPERNPGDHSAIPALTREEFARQLEMAANFTPTSAWLRERMRLLLEDHAERKGSARL